MRIVKRAEIRRKEILDAADELFNQKGFDKTTTNDILKKVGIARGTLYYYFDSKEDIMDALIERFHYKLLEEAQIIAKDKQIPAEQRIIQTILALNVNKTTCENNELFKHIHKPQNALMHEKIEKIILKTLTPILTEIIYDGIEQKVFATNFPYETVEMFIMYSHSFFGNYINEMSEEEKEKRIQAFIYNIEKLLSTKSGIFKPIISLFQK